MQTAAMTSRFLTDCSSNAGLADPEIVVSRCVLLRHIVASHLALTIHSQELFVKLTNELIRFAEQAYVGRDLATLAEVSTVLMSLPVEAARQVGLYYYAIKIKRSGQISEAQRLLETVADAAPVTYRARAIQGLGAVHHDLGQLDEALRFQLEALRAASDRTARGFQTTLLARWEISTIRGLDGDHRAALSDLRNLRPLVNLAAKQQPFYFYAYCNDLAVELGELGRVSEAEAVLEEAVSSPYAPAYPNWAATRQELAAKRASATPSSVAVTRLSKTAPLPQAQQAPRSNPTAAFHFSEPASNDTHLQRASRIASSATLPHDEIASILDRVLICIRSRAPPTRS